MEGSPVSVSVTITVEYGKGLLIQYPFASVICVSNTSPVDFKVNVNVLPSKGTLILSLGFSPWINLVNAICPLMTVLPMVIG